jgi:3-keto steroid reductase
MRPEAYESAKRLTDLLSLTSSLPAAQPFSSRFFTIADDPQAAKKQVVKPRFYLTHPGVVASTLFPVPWIIFWAYKLILIISRWLGSPWHNADAERIKWGSSTDTKLNVRVKKTEVDGWGWEGKPETANDIAMDPSVGVLRKSVGRKIGVRDVTADDIAEFEEIGAQCWQQLEVLRAQWEDIIEHETE